MLVMMQREISRAMGPRAEELEIVLISRGNEVSYEGVHCVYAVECILGLLTERSTLNMISLSHQL